MGLRKILTDKDPALHKVCKPVEKFDWRLHKLLDDMRETLIDSNGVGLAAPQIGILKRIFVISEELEEGFRRYILINPKVISRSEEFGNYGPYIQSEREDIYKAFVKHLIEQGLAIDVSFSIQ